MKTSRLRTLVLSGAASLALSPLALASQQAPTTEQLKQRYEAALESPFIAKGHWVLDYDEAKARAKREGKLIFAYFSRSYAP